MAERKTLFAITFQPHIFARKNSWKRKTLYTQKVIANRLKSCWTSKNGSFSREIVMSSSLEIFLSQRISRWRTKIQTNPARKLEEKNWKRKNEKKDRKRFLSVRLIQIESNVDKYKVQKQISRERRRWREKLLNKRKKIYIATHFNKTDSFRSFHRAPLLSATHKPLFFLLSRSVCWQRKYISLMFVWLCV